MIKVVIVLVAVVSLISGCASGPSNVISAAPQHSPNPAPEGPLEAPVDAALQTLISSLFAGDLDLEALETIGASEDPRLGWIVSDLLRFLQGTDRQDALVIAFQRLTGVDPRNERGFGESPWQTVTNDLITWNLPAPPGYTDLKARIFLQVEPAWEPFFTDPDAAIDWRHVSWGGVLIDDRPLGDTKPCERGCIPALDDPALTAAAGGDWYPDDRIVFGVVVGADEVALPKNIMEVHEMVNLTIGGRRLGIPYCTLCGSAQAYFTDSVPAGVAVPVLRTSGLLALSNKVMYDLVTRSVFDTFTGRALSGPLHDAGVVLAETTVVVTTWGEWKATHPNSRIVARDGGIGRIYPEDPLGGRDDNGPIFPIARVDPRLPGQANVVGVIAPDGTPIAFPVEQARAALAEGQAVVVGDVEVIADGGGLRARMLGGGELATHQAFWFAWSQFHPGTVVWTPLNQ